MHGGALIRRSEKKKLAIGGRGRKKELGGVIVNQRVNS